jgi:cell wall assembly regulator SMI1
VTTTDVLDADLAAIEDWLQRYAPVSFNTLRPGLNPAGLVALETRYGFPVDPDLRTVLFWHDGCAHSPQAVQLRPSFMFGESEFMYEQVQDWRGDDDYWDCRWVPIATDLGLKKLIVDHATVPGRVMLFDGVDGIYEDGIYEDWKWPSLGAMIAQLREALTTPSLLDGYRADVKNGELVWTEMA